MNYCLDTSLCVELLRKGTGFDAIELELPQCSISSIARCELEYGVEKAPSPIKGKLRARLTRLLDNVNCMDFDASAAVHAASIRAELERKGTPIGHFDTLIAGHARSEKQTLVTGNGREFERVPKLKVISI